MKNPFHSKKTLVLGASTNPERYSNIATKLLLKHGHEVALVGIKKGSIEGNEISSSKENIIENIDTITLYVGPQNQQEWYNYILKTKPKRIIFNPGTENEELMALASQNNIEFEEACTLVLLNTGQY